jgi:hypothetical protein
MYINIGRTDVVKSGRFWLRVDQRGRRSSKGVDCDILAQDLIGFDRILIPSRYTFFSRSLTKKNSGVKRVWPGAISGWMTDRKVFQNVHK